MPEGFEAYDASGNPVVSITTRMGRVLGKTTISPGVDGSVTNAQFATGTPFWRCVARSGGLEKLPDISISGNTLSWSFQSAHTYSATDYRLRYGVY